MRQIWAGLFYCELDNLLIVVHWAADFSSLNKFKHNITSMDLSDLRCF